MLAFAHQFLLLPDVQELATRRIQTSEKIQIILNDIFDFFVEYNYYIPI